MFSPTSHLTETRMPKKSQPAGMVSYSFCRTARNPIIRGYPCCRRRSGSQLAAQKTVQRCTEKWAALPQAAGSHPSSPLHRCPDPCRECAVTRPGAARCIHFQGNTTRRFAAPSAVVKLPEFCRCGLDAVEELTRPMFLRSCRKRIPRPPSRMVGMTSNR